MPPATTPRISRVGPSWEAQLPIPWSRPISSTGNCPIFSSSAALRSRKTPPPIPRPRSAPSFTAPRTPSSTVTSNVRARSLRRSFASPKALDFVASKAAPFAAANLLLSCLFCFLRFLRTAHNVGLRTFFSPSRRIPLCLVLLIQPSLERRKIIRQRGRIHLLLSRQRFQRFLPRFALSH